MMEKKLGFFIPNLNEALKLVGNSKAFKVKKELVDGEEFTIICYRFVDYEDFLDDYRKLEFRGIAYHNETGKAFLSCHKFFNYGEVPETDYLFNNNDNEVLATEKVDGSLIVPIYINNKLLLKTRQSFKSEHCNTAYEFITDNLNYYKFIKDCFSNNLIPLFELLSPKHRIVIPYSETILKLIQIRDLSTGNYLPYERLQELAQEYQVDYVKADKLSVEELERLCVTEEGIEGYVAIVDYTNPFGFKKFKTSWYLHRHKIMTDLHLHEAVQLILEDKVDDLLSILPKDFPLYKETMRALNLINNLRYVIEKKVGKLKKLNLDRKEFVRKYKNDLFFPVIVKAIYEDRDVDLLLKSFILKKCNKLKQAKRFLIEVENYLREDTNA